MVFIGQVDFLAFEINVTIFGFVSILVKFHTKITFDSQWYLVSLYLDTYSDSYIAFCFPPSC